MTEALTSVFPQTLVERAALLIASCRAKGVTIATAESCTGGLVAALLTEIAGSSAVFERGLVTYSNDAKMALLGVPQTTLDRFGAVSAPTASAMAAGAMQRSSTSMAVAITGIAGPDGGSDAKPVGLVYFGLAVRGRDTVTLERRFGSIGRSAVRMAAVDQALDLLERAGRL